MKYIKTFALLAFFSIMQLQAAANFYVANFDNNTSMPLAITFKDARAASFTNNSKNQLKLTLPIDQVNFIQGNNPEFTKKEASKAANIAYVRKIDTGEILYKLFVYKTTDEKNPSKADIKIELRDNKTNKVVADFTTTITNNNNQYNTDSYGINLSFTEPRRSEVVPTGAKLSVDVKS